MDHIRRAAVVAGLIAAMILGRARPAFPFTSFDFTNNGCGVVLVPHIYLAAGSPNVTRADLLKLRRQAGAQIRKAVRLSNLSPSCCRRVRADPEIAIQDATTPTAPPGYTQITVTDGAVTGTSCNAEAPANSVLYGCTAVAARNDTGWPTSSGVWSLEPLKLKNTVQDPGPVYAHEFGHLVGLRSCLPGETCSDPIMQVATGLMRSSTFGDGLADGILCKGGVDCPRLCSPLDADCLFVPAPVCPVVARVCGNNVSDSGEDCDGTDDASCVGDCVKDGSIAGCTCNSCFASGPERGQTCSSVVPCVGGAIPLDFTVELGTLNDGYTATIFADFTLPPNAGPITYLCSGSPRRCTITPPHSQQVWIAHFDIMSAVTNWFATGNPFVVIVDTPAGRIESTCSVSVQ